jgi:hypothetical protein
LTGPLDCNFLAWCASLDGRERSETNALTQRSNFTIDGTKVELLQFAWESARSWTTTKLKKGLKINTQHFKNADAQQINKKLF